MVSILSLGGPSGLRSHRAPHVNKYSTTYVFLIFLMEVIQLFVAETNKHYKPVFRHNFHMTVQEMYTERIVLLDFIHRLVSQKN
jgi:hypothetical protein